MSRSDLFVRLSWPAIALWGSAAVLSAQQPVTRAHAAGAAAARRAGRACGRARPRAQAAAAALARGARSAFGRADTAAAAGVLRTARLYPNPTATASYSKDV